ncbi:MAG: nicotinate-nucleotide adenylyltransferase [Syntrophomonadaceae bacterium]|jgi:nicotinate-nucleotide adenylyltransferase
MKQRKPVGIFGGTFDPIHYGHLVAAEHSRHILGLDKVIFVPAARPSHKSPVLVSHPKDRFNMVEIAVKDNPFFEVSTIELHRLGTSYTIDTVECLLTEDPDLDLHLIIGLDSYLSLDTWKEYRRLSALCRLVVVNRPGYNVSKDLSRSEPHAISVSIPGMEISSSNIRYRVAKGMPIRYLLPDGVAEYIRNRGLYREGGASNI